MAAMKLKYCNSYLFSWRVNRTLFLMGTQRSTFVRYFT